MTRATRVIAVALCITAALVAPEAAAQAGGGRVAAAPSDSANIALLERTAATYRGSRSLRAEFTQFISSARGGTPMRSSGEFFQQGSQRFAFRFTTPPDDRIVADGEVLWLYLPSSAKGQVLKVPRAVGAGLDIAATVLREPAKRFTITGLRDSTIENTAVRTIRLAPRSGSDAPFTKATLWIDPRMAVVRRAEFTELSGLQRTLEFRKVRTGSRLPSGVFTFTPPAGVKVIDQAALLTPR
ncbi:MAG: LolA family protein [Gemmatimonadaceae bacterium]